MINNRLKRVQLFLGIIISLITPIQFSARDFTHDGLIYTVIDEDAFTVETKQGREATGNSYIHGNEISGEITIPDIVSDGTTNYTVIRIGKYGFVGTPLTSITLPQTITEIEELAFFKCTNLKSINILDSELHIGNQAFSNCDNLSTINFGNSLKSIGNSAFFNCTSITRLNLPNSVTSIGRSAFNACTNLTTVNLPCNLSEITPYLFKSCEKLESIDIPNPVTTIGEYSFDGCNNLTNITIGNSVTEIGQYAFYECNALANLDLPNSLISIDRCAFYNCSSIKNINFSNCIQSIGADAFHGCKALKSVELPNSLNTLYGMAFSECTNLKSVILPNSIAKLPSFLFNNCSQLETVTIPISVKSIDNYAFGYCTKLKSVILPNSVTEIGEKAFYGCTGLIKSAYPSNIADPFPRGISVCYPSDNTIIEDNLIWNNDKSALYFVSYDVCGEISIPASVNTIGEHSFTCCNQITALNMQGISPANISDNSFNGLYDTTDVIVPDNSMAAYLNTRWSLFKNLREAQSGIIATQFTDDPFSYRIVSDNKVCLMKGNYASMTSVEIPDRIVYDDKLYTVSTIGYEAFANTNIDELALPRQLSEIGVNAFANCSRLVKLQLPNSMLKIDSGAFRNCAALTSISMNANLESIGNSAFYKCLNLTELALNDNLSIIDNNAFKDCTALSKLTFNDNLTNIGEYAFSGCGQIENIMLPKALTIISPHAFENCKGLQSLTFNDVLSSIGESAFNGCNIHGELILNRNLTTIGDYAFYGNKEITSIKFNSLTDIGSHTFSKCSGLSSITLPNSIQSVGSGCFSDCPTLIDFTIEDGLSKLTIGSNILLNTPIHNMYIGRDLNCIDYNNLCPELSTLTFGNTVTNINDNAFKGCNDLKTVRFGSSIITVGTNAFSECALKDVVLPPALELIGANAFSNNNITHLTMGAKIAEIGEYAFDGNNLISDINITTPIPPTANNNSFSNYNCTLYLSGEQSKDAYYNCPRCWYRFSSHDILVDATQIVIDGENVLKLQPGETVKLNASLTPYNASLPYIFWHSSHPHIASVDNDGNVTYHGNGDFNHTEMEQLEECKIIAESLYPDCVAAAITIVDANSGIDYIYDNTSNDTKATYPNDIYNLQGICIKRNANQQDIDNLSPGLYIIRGKKTLIK